MNSYFKILYKDFSNTLIKSSLGRITIKLDNTDLMTNIKTDDIIVVHVLLKESTAILKVKGFDDDSIVLEKMSEINYCIEDKDNFNSIDFFVEEISKETYYNIVKSIIHYYDLMIMNESSIDYSNVINKDLKGENTIYYGAPGSGKNYFLESQIDLSKSIKTTFHPDCDYSTFVGSFKPAMDKDKIIYSFVPQAFAKAYVKAWKDLNTPCYLVVDEINRANCAQVFGDIFQLLDRKHSGFSEYTININKDFADYIRKELENTQYLSILKKIYKVEFTNEDYSCIALPNNLYIYATMNTSDQSLFPIDSAFKRRWKWRYIPINYQDAETFTIELGDKKYSWRAFLEKINPIILKLKDSDDKQMGNRFVNPENGIISLDLFRSKVLFYLWSEVFKDEQDSPLNIFKKKIETETVNIGFKDFFPENDSLSVDIINSFMEANGIDTKQ